MAFTYTGGQDADPTPEHNFEVARTAGGSDVRIYSRDTGRTGRIHGAYWANGDWHHSAWFGTGHVNPPDKDGVQWESKLDLVLE